MRVHVTHGDRVVFPEVGVTKDDVVAYYRSIARWMAPLLRSRPLTLHRFPEGLRGDGFVQQDIGGLDPPEWLDRVSVPKLSGGSTLHPMVRRADDLAWLANMGVITVHMWTARAQDLDHPDLVVFDFDPPDGDDGNAFSLVREAAVAARDLLERIGLRPFAQLTGSRGVHVVAPVSDAPDFDATRAFARSAAEHLVERDPDRLTLAQRKADRGARLYVDVMRNGYAQTMVAPYAVRARPGASVATPIEWSELSDPDLRADRYTVFTVREHVARHGNPWRGINRHARSLGAAERRLASL